MVPLHFGSRLRDRSPAVSKVCSALTGRLVDSDTNILTVNLFARADDEDSFVAACWTARRQQDPTCIAVAHRLSTVVRRDRLTVLDDARVVE